MRHEEIALPNRVVHAACAWLERMRSSQAQAAHAPSLVTKSLDTYPTTFSLKVNTSSSLKRGDSQTQEHFEMNVSDAA